jgi:hypothetical protein
MYCTENSSAYCPPNPYNLDNGNFWYGGTSAAATWESLAAIHMGAKIAPVASYTAYPLTNTSLAKELSYFACPGAAVVDGTYIPRTYTMNLGVSPASGSTAAEVSATTPGNALPIKNSIIQDPAGTIQLFELISINSGDSFRMTFARHSAGSYYDSGGCDAGTFGSGQIGNPVKTWVYTAASANSSFYAHGTARDPKLQAVMYDGHVELTDRSWWYTTPNVAMPFRFTKN